MIIYFSISNVAAQTCLSSDNPLLYPYNLYFFNVYLFTLEILFKNDCPPVSSFHFISQYKTQHENFPSSSVGKRTHLQCRRHRFDPWAGKIPWRRAWQPVPVFLPGESHGQRSLAGYSPWSHKESDMTKTLHNNKTQHIHFLSK